MNIRVKGQHSYSGYSGYTTTYNVAFVTQDKTATCAYGHSLCVVTENIQTEAEPMATPTNKTKYTTWASYPLKIRDKSHAHKYVYITNYSVSKSGPITVYDIESCRPCPSDHPSCQYGKVTGYTHYWVTKISASTAIATTPTWKPSVPFNIRSRIKHNHGTFTKTRIVAKSLDTHGPRAYGTCSAGHSNCYLSYFTATLKYDAVTADSSCGNAYH